jgi:hypothetical protein
MGTGVVMGEASRGQIPGSLEQHNKELGVGILSKEQREDVKDRKDSKKKKKLETLQDLLPRAQRMSWGDELGNEVDPGRTRLYLAPASSSKVLLHRKDGARRG